MITLTDRDWAEIHAALDSKLKSATTDGDNEWRGHLIDIMEKIGADGADAAEQGVAPLHDQFPKVLIIVEGGNVQNVLSTAPVDFVVKDYDNIKEQGERFNAEELSATETIAPENFFSEAMKDVDPKTGELK